MELEVARILKALRRGDFIITRHAKLRMRERNVDLDDIFNLGRSPVEVHEQGNSVYKIVGHDMESEPLTVIATCEAGIVIITVY